MGWVGWRARSQAARERDRQVGERADQQHRWAVHGDPRGVYGPDGARLMHDLSAGGAARQLPEPPGPDLPVAEVVRTEADLAALLRERLPSWRYAAFVSVLVQRQAAVGSRLRDARMGFFPAAGPTMSTGLETGRFFAKRLGDLSELVAQIDGFMLSAGFQEVFGDPHDGDSADADGVVHAAHRLMDYHDRALTLSEQCRAVRVPHDCRDLQRDFALLTALPLDAFATFIDVFATRVTEMADVARFATGDVELDPVELSIAGDDEALQRISEKLRQLARQA